MKHLLCILLNLYWIFSDLDSVSALDKSIDFIYSPFYLKKHDISDTQGASTKVKVASIANLVFVSVGYAGLIVLDGVTNEIIFQ